MGAVFEVLACSCCVMLRVLQNKVGLRDMVRREDWRDCRLVKMVEVTVGWMEVTKGCGWEVGMRGFGLR